MRFELYQSADGSYTFLPHDHKQLAILCGEGATKLWETDAPTYFSAMQAYYTHMGWGTYHRDPAWPDTVYSTEGLHS